MASVKPHSEPSDVDAEAGPGDRRGPDGSCGDAHARTQPEETGHRMIDAAGRSGTIRRDELRKAKPRRRAGR